MSTDDHAPAQTPPTRSFSEGHKRALTAAARLRSQEQAVGNYIRRWNRELFAVLLGEASQPPTTQALGALLQALSSEVKAGPLDAPPSTARGAGSLSAPNPREAEEPRRPPPPKMDIL